MKPFRGKRRGPQSLPVGFKSVGRSARPSSHPQRARRAATSGDRRVHFRRAERHDRFAGGQKPSGKVADSQGFGVIDPGGVGPLADRGRLHRAVGRGSAAPCVRSNCGDCRQCPLAASARRWWIAEVGSGSVANRSVTCPTRLETRTKESNMCASHWVLRNLEAK